MGLRLQTVTPGQGWLWFRDGVRLFFRKPLAFSLMLLAYLFASLVVMSLPIVGVLGLAAWPLLSLSIMVASRAALRGEAVHLGQLIEPLRASSPGRRTLLGVCAVYGGAAFAVVALTTWIQGDAAQALWQAIQSHGVGSPEAMRAMSDPRVTNGLLVLSLLGALLAIPFWHAPALVHWEHQGLWQALFSSTVAVWRAKAAFAVYGLAWMGASLGLSMLLGLAVGLLRLATAAVLLMPALTLMLTAAFYVSVWFSFVDSFATGPDAAPSSAPPPTV
jgi:hypothetical protein